MDAIGTRHTRPSLSSTTLPRSRRQHKSPRFYHGLLLFFLILCLAPVSALDQSAVDRPGQDGDGPRSAPDPSGGIIADLHERSAPSPTISEEQHATEFQDGHELPILHRRIANASMDDSPSMPTPFDSLASNFANASCTKFFNKFLNDPTITNCHPLSLLLENSNSFFHSLSSAASTTRVLDTACSKTVSECAPAMSSIASQLLQDDTCGPDYHSKNGVVKGAYRALVAYEPLYHASCLTSPTTKAYCFVDAVTNSTAEDDYNVYFMPLGSSLGSSAKPTCNKCLQATMGVFAHWAAVDNQPLDNTYMPSAKAVNEHCGDDFVSTNVTVGSNTIASRAALSVAFPDFRVAVSIIGLVLGATATGLF
ncbi:hypothetical protein NUU61_001209 [Penicillium alfredii]|uniref:DUF7729 domain-containing protein n=1 Tax=Penicillium alfredii TaxID=1506179 RepID=A0A9W9GB29_9EURO|nr:uncharacterized protein NUU61_001209 [Penicillium alfredii]KAJ5115450.1 hypothetical protein NUU61_001209 [Penicillium alfredii]